MKQLPHSVAGLIDDLEATYPPRCKSLDETPEAHSRYAGKVELIVLLRAQYEAIGKAEKNKLPSVLNN
jgi:hypothetical protein